jgi:TP901 family phage tail tape measure protein
MAQRFDLTAQLQLQAPTNTRQVVNQIRQQLQGVNVNVDVQANARAVQQVNRSLQNTSKQANNASRSIGTLNKNLSEAARRFGIITLATGTMLSFAQSVKKAVREAVEFERELVKISQVTGKSVQQLSSLTSEITRLSTSLGVSSSKLLETSRVLAQAGFSADETRKALDILAKTTLGSSFDDITKTVEGSIAVLRQFRAEALATGGEIKFLEQTLDAINSVSKSFAVESSDLIAVIQRVGGVFASAGGSVNELIALFTSVRATTRESAETIATGLRTIFTRIQRTDTVNQLEQLGISLRDAQGRFVGAYEAVRRLSLGLSALDPRDYRFSEIVEELGGFRQIGKVIPLIQQFTIAQDALNVAQSASGSVAEDALTAQQSLAVQVQKVKEEFAALIRQFADSSTFRSIASAALQLASALIKIGEALEPVLPLLTSLLALKIGQGLAPGLGALLGFGGRRKYGGGVIRKFASGGFVPGVGNSDSVPAMLQPGEFVIRKSSAQKLGAETLLAMNQNKYANGVKVAKSGNVTKKDIAAASNSELEDVLNNKNLSVASRLGIESELGRRKNKPKIATLKEGIVGGLFLQEGEGGKRGISKDLKGIQLQSNFPRVDRIEGNIYTGLLDKRASSEIRSQLEPNIINAVQSAASNTIKTFEIPPLGIDESQAAKSAVQKVDTTAIEGYIFEAFISAISGAQLSEAGATFDYVNPSSSAKGRLKNIFGPDPVMGRLLDAKRTLNSDTVQSGKSSIANKIVAGINSGLLSREDFIVRNKGGGVGTDTVPALLTPGEFVINKSAAQSIGYTNLSNMNKTGVAKFAKGGAVGVKQFANGGQATVSGSQLNDVLAGGTIIVQLQGGGSGNDDLSDQQRDQVDNLEDSNKKMETFSSKMDKIAGSLQSFVFLGGLAASLGAQFGDLSEETQAAIAETSGFVTAVAGTSGTLLQMVSSIVSSTSSNAANSASKIANSAATNANTASQSRAAAAGSGLAVGIGLAVVAITAIAGAFKFYAAQARAEAKSLKEASDSQFKAIQDGTGSIRDFTDSISQASQKEAQAAALDAGSTGALFAGAGGASIGATIGTMIAPGIGTAIGAVIGGAAGAIVGGLDAYTNELNRQADIAARFGTELERSANTLGSLAQAQASFKQALSDIDIEENLTPEERVSRRLTAQAEVGPTNQLAIAEANRQLELLAKEVDKPVSQLTKADFEKFPTLANTYDLATKTLATATQGLAQDVSESRKTLAEAASIELTGDQSFDEVIASGGQVAQALQASRQAIIADAQARRDSLQAQLQGDISADKRAQIEQQIIDTDERLNRQLKDQYDGLKAMNEEARKNKIALEQSIAAQEAYRQSLMRIMDFTNSLVAAEQQLNQFEDSLSSMEALNSGRSLDFSTRTPAGLDDLSQVGDRGAFEQGIDAIAQNLGPEGQRLAGIVKNTSRLIEDANANLINVRFDPTGDLPTATDVLNQLGLSEADLGPAFGKFKADFTKAMSDGILSPEEFDDIFGPIIENGEKSAEALKKANDLQNRQLDLYGKYIDQLQAQRDKEIAARQSVVDAQLKGAELRAQGRGGELSASQRAGFARQRAQIGLGGITDTTGRQVQAGNLAQVAATKAAAKAEREKIAQLKQSTNFDRLSAQQKQQLIARDKELIDIIGKTSDEIARMSESTEEADAALEAIGAAAARREALAGIVEDFVVGGQQERLDINKAFAGIQQAVASGSLQGQTEEQRKATVEMLEKLGDITIPGTGGMSAQQVKQELVFRDAVRLGLDPAVAKQLATQTTEEQRLIQALDRLTQAIEDAAVVQAQGNAMGGLVYRANGGAIFKPKGTDTVPAMLTPGEFVLRKSAVDKIGVGPLTSLNNGDSSMVYRQFGGSIGREGQQDTYGFEQNYRGGTQFTGQSPNVNIATPEMLKRAFTEDIMNMSPKDLLGAIRQTAGTDSEAFKAAVRLYRMGQLTSNKVDIEGMILPAQKVLENLIANIDMIEEASGAGITIRAPRANESVMGYIKKLQGLDLEIPMESMRLLNGFSGRNTKPLIDKLADFQVRNIPQFLADDTLGVLRKYGFDENDEDITFKEFNKKLGMASRWFSDDLFDEKIGAVRFGARTTISPLSKQYKRKEAASRDETILRSSGIFFNKGGMVPDTVPAMLTPGEFVMNRESVAKHGIGFMKSLNQGNVPGFNKGGLVGGGGVQYRQNGGQINGGGANCF